jgi:hypothetical protein
MAAKSKVGDDKRGKKRKRVQLIPFAGPILFGAFHDECGAKANIFSSKKAVPVAVVFVNVGICSLDVAVNGVSVRQIPSRARRPDVVVAPAATSIDVDCVLNVRHGDCDYFFFLIPL